MAVGRVHRLLRLITLLQSGRARTGRELMAELGVSRRTLFRDLKMMQEAGIPYYHEPGNGYRLASYFFLPPISLTMPEALGLMLLGKAAARDRDRPLIAAALSGIYKLLSTVPEPIRSAGGEMLAHVSIGHAAQLVPVQREADAYVLLQQCVDEQRACRIVYRSPVETEPIRCRLDPYALHFVGRAWYALGHTDVHREVRVFKLARIESIELAGRRFDRPRRFRVEDKLGNAWQLIPEGREYEIELEFTARVAMNVSEVRWHPTQAHEILDDGRCRMRFRIDGLNEIAWWLCGYADQVRIVKPRKLRERVREMLERAVANHAP
ncbi:MAG: WYL domain-containing protein [Phycisphaeraceae bacterium]